MLDSILPGTYKLKVEREHYATLIKEVTVTANNITYANTFLEKDRSEPLAIKSYSPNFSLDTPISCGTEIRFTFNFEVDVESFQKGFHITPEVSGTFSYEQYQRVAIFTPDAPLAVGTKYTVSLDKEVQHIGGLGLENDFSFEFITKDVNVFEVLDYYPKNGGENIYPNMLVKVYFSEPLMGTSTSTQYFKLVDEAGNVQTQNGVQVNAYPGELGVYSFKGYLEPNKKYTLKMDAGVKSADSLYVTQDLEFTFTTGSDNVITVGQIDDFEESGLFVIDTDKTLNINADITVMSRYSSLSVSGSRSYQLYYEFTKDEAYVTADYVISPALVTNEDDISLYIYGDLSYNLLNLIVSDGENDFVFSFGEIDFSGWDYKTLTIKDLDSNKQYSIKGFQLVSSGSVYSRGGLILVDNMLKNALTSIKEEPISEADRFSIYPNPVENRLYFGGITEKTKVQLISLDGKVIKDYYVEADLISVDVSFLEQGLYLISLESSDFKSTTTFIKK